MILLSFLRHTLLIAIIDITPVMHTPHSYAITFHIIITLLPCFHFEAIVISYIVTIFRFTHSASHITPFATPLRHAITLLHIMPLQSLILRILLPPHY